MKPLLALLLLASTLSAEPRWIRRLTAAAACAASAADYITTQHALAAGAIETNPLLASRPGMTLPLKAAICGLGAIAQETRTFGLLPRRASDRFWMMVNVGETAGFGMTARHNAEVANGS
jgi:hypothetical protein